MYKIGSSLPQRYHVTYLGMVTLGRTSSQKSHGRACLLWWSILFGALATTCVNIMERQRWISWYTPVANWYIATGTEIWISFLCRFLSCRLEFFCQIVCKQNSQRLKTHWTCFLGTLYRSYSDRLFHPVCPLDNRSSYAYYILRRKCWHQRYILESYNRFLAMFEFT